VRAGIKVDYNFDFGKKIEEKTVCVLEAPMAFTRFTHVSLKKNFTLLQTHYNLNRDL